MGKINILSDTVISQIAAGEVIERPAYAVKELIENALDANAKNVRINLSDTGLTKIEVIDDGEGMDQEDVLLSFKPHTTSKLKTEELLGIGTFGFRGEALSSLASVSSLTIQSKRKKAVAGVQVRVFQNTLEKVQSIGMPEGTRVVVEHLFRSIPARKKFLKSNQTELRHTIDIVVSYALAYPSVSFLLTHNDKTILDLSRSSLLERIKETFGETISLSLLQVSYQDSFIKITGFISRPSLISPSSQKIFTWVNNRPIVDKLTTLAIKEAYGTLLPASSYPICFLFLTIPFEHVDVNVHPRKREVQFINQRFVFDILNRAVSTTLLENNLVFQKNLSQPLLSPEKDDELIVALLKKEVLSKNLLSRTQLAIKNDIFQFHNTFLVAELDSGLLLIDQHAAHERILYDQFSKAFEKKKFVSQKINQIALKLSASESEVVREYKSVFKELGFTIQEESQRKFVVSTVPAIFVKHNVSNMLHEMIDDLLQGLPVTSIDRRIDRLLKYLSCKAAVKAGEPLTQEQRKDLLLQLRQTNIPFTCPHGRPTMVQMSKRQLLTLFRRK